MKKIVVFFCICVFLSTTSSALPYSKNELYKSPYGVYIKALDDNGALPVFKEGNFYPEKEISKEEALSMILRTSNFLSKLKKDHFEHIQEEEERRRIANDSTLKAYYEQLQSQDEEKEREEESQGSHKKNLVKVSNVQVPIDVTGRWSEYTVRKFIEIGTIENDSQKLFKPQDKITREEFANFLCTYLESLDFLLEEKEIDASDIENSPYVKKIRKSLAYGIMKKKEDGAFKPKDFITRGEVAKILSQCLQLNIDPLPPLEEKYTILNVPYVSQLYPVYAPIGCEPTSVYAALRYKGYAQEISHRQFLDGMPHDYIDPRRGFVGSYTGYQNYAKRETIFPNALAAYAKKYGDVEDISGYSMQQIKEELFLDNPVVVYVTLWWQNPAYKAYWVEGKSYTWLRNNHVVVLCGYDPKTNMYYVSDPYNKKNLYGEYKYWVNGARLEELYFARRHAIVVR